MSTQAFTEKAQKIELALQEPPQPFVIYNSRRVDARGSFDKAWIIAINSVIVASGQGEETLASTLRSLGLESVVQQANADKPTVYQLGSTQYIDAQGHLLTPGFIDIHSHGAQQHSFDDGKDGINIARAGHMLHGTTRQVLSLITNPIEVISENLRAVHQAANTRPDVLGAHLEGPFIALSRKGAHDPACLRNPEPAVLDQLLEAAQHCIRQVTIAPELECGLEAIKQLAAAQVVPAVGHCDANYEQSSRAFDAGARILTHIFNAMNGIQHRQPGPIPAAMQDTRVIAELINDGFHVQDSVVRLAFQLFPHRIALITDAMEATGCPDGSYKLGSLDVTVKEGHARLVSNGAIAGSTLTLDVAVRRAVENIGLSAQDAIEAATLTPAKALQLDRPNAVTGAPLGLLAPTYAADMLLLDPTTFEPQTIICDGHQVV